MSSPSSSSITAITATTTTTPPPHPHLLVFPYPAQGHMLPLIDLLHRLSLHHHHSNPSSTLTITVIVTPMNLPLLTHLLSSHPPTTTIAPLVLSLPPHPSLPSSAENVKDLPSSSLSAALAHALVPLSSPILLWAKSHPHPPTALLSDFFLGWTASLATDLAVPHIAFWSSGALLASVLHHLWAGKGDPTSSSAPAGDGVMVTFATIPGSPSFPFPHLPALYRRYRDGSPEWECMRGSMVANSTSWGAVFNSFDALEGPYLNHLRAEYSHRRVWAVGPILPAGGNVEERGGPASIPAGDLAEWLDGCPEGSVVYVSFGSQYTLPHPQAKALAGALEMSGVRFIWAVKEVEGKSVVPEGFERATEGRGVVVRGWAPQVAVLRHGAVGAFVTHCGWNSVLEGLVAGVALVAWPAEAEQFVNTRLLVEELGVGVRAWEGGEGVPDPAELGRVLREAVDGGGEKSAVRARAAELGRMALEAVAEGGSSERDLDGLLRALCGPTEWGLDGPREIR